MPANGCKRVRPGRRLSLHQVLAIQEIAHEAALGLRDDFRDTKDREQRARVASAIANLGKSWVSLQDAKREILGKPKAGVRKHAVEKTPKRKPNGFGPIGTPFTELPDNAPLAAETPAA